MVAQRPLFIYGLLLDCSKRTFVRSCPSHRAPQENSRAVSDVRAKSKMMVEYRRIDLLDGFDATVYSTGMIDQLQKLLGRITENEPLLKHTNFRIGGPATYFFEATSSDELVKAVEAAQELGLPFFVLGGGSNVLVSDEGFPGFVIKAANRGYVIRAPSAVSVESGVLSAFLARKTAEAGLTGFEWAISLPGTIGGAVRGNAGCFGGEMRDVVKSVDVFDPQKTESYKLKAESCQFGYRDSLFKHMDPAPIVLSVELELKQDDPKACLAQLEEKLRLRKEKQPLEASSAGCIFKNFEFHDRSEIAKLESVVTVPEEFIAMKRIPAAWLIDQRGLKGKRIDDAMVSEKHGNFIMNLGKATASDVVQLVSLIKLKVRNEFGVQLQEEVQYVGF